MYDSTFSSNPDRFGVRCSGETKTGLPCQRKGYAIGNQAYYCYQHPNHGDTSKPCVASIGLKSCILGFGHSTRHQYEGPS